METALRYEIEKSIPELKNNIYPTHAPEDSKGPYLVYTRIKTKRIKTLEGYTDKQALSYMLSVMVKRYEHMKELREEVEKLLLSFTQKEIGNKKKFYIEDIDINNIDEQYEHQLGVNRGIIDFTIYF